MEIYEKVEDSRSSKSNTVRFSHMELVNQHDFRNDDGVSNPMRLFKLVSACLALGLFASLVSAEEKLRGTERCSSERCSSYAKQDEPVAREPAEMVKKVVRVRQ